MEKGKISAWQASIVTITHPLGTGLFVLPAVAINWAREDAWLTHILVLIPIMVLIFTVEKLGRMFPGQTIVQYSETIMGKYFGKLIGLLIAWYFLSIGSVIIYEMASFMVSAIMPETPIVVFIVFTGAVIVYTINKGLEVIARLNVWFFPIIVVSMFLIFVLSAKDMNLDYFRPFLANGLKPVFIGSFAPYGWIGTIFCMSMMIPYINQPKQVKIPYLCAALILTLLFMLNTMGNLAVFGPFEGGRISLPIVHLVKLISVADFIEHIEVLLVLIWVGGVFTMSTGWFYFSVLGMAQTLKLKDYRPLSIPMMVIYISLATLNFDNYAEFIDWAQFTWPFFAFFCQIIIPVLLLLTAIIRDLSAKQTNVKQRDGQI